MRFGEGGVTRRQGDGGTRRRGDHHSVAGCLGSFVAYASKYLCRARASPPLRLFAFSCGGAAFSLSDCDFEFLSSLCEIAALVQRAAQIAVSLGVISVTDFQSQLKFAYRLFKLSASVEHKAEI